MNTPEKQMTHEESLALIQSMILTARNKVAEDGFQFLLWGILVIVASLVNYLLFTTGFADKAGLVWLILPIVGWPISYIYEKRKDKSQQVETYADKNAGYVWIAYGITMFFTIFYSIYIKASPIPFILLLTGMATFTSGLTLKFRPLIFGGIVFWLFAVATFFTEPAIHLLLNAVAIALGYLIPGCMLRRQAKSGSNV